MDILFQDIPEMTKDEFIYNARSDYTEPEFWSEIGARAGMGMDYHATWQLLEGTAGGDIGFDTPETMVGGVSLEMPPYPDGLRDRPWTNSPTEEYLARLKQQEAIAWSQEDYQERIAGREGLKDLYTEDMTEWKTDQLIDNYDTRRYREYIMSISPGGLAREITGFAAMLGVQATDPINYIPLFGYGKNVALLGKFARLQNFVKAYPKLGAFTLGALDAATATAVTDALIIPRLRAQGEEAPWSNLVWDVVFSAGLGGVMSLGSLAFHKAIDEVDGKKPKGTAEAEAKMEKHTRKEAQTRYKEGGLDYTVKDEANVLQEIQDTFRKRTGIDEPEGVNTAIDENIRMNEVEDLTMQEIDARAREDTEFTKQFEDMNEKTINDWWDAVIERRNSGELEGYAERLVNETELHIARAEKKADAIPKILHAAGDQDEIAKVMKEFDLTQGEVRELSDTIERMHERYGEKDLDANVKKLADREKLAALRQRHHAIVNLAATDNILNDVSTRFEDFWRHKKTKHKLEKPWLEMFEGSERPGAGAQSSIDTLRGALKAVADAKFWEIINKVKGLREKVMPKFREGPQARADRVDLEANARLIMEGDTTIKDPDAKQLALAWRTATEYVYKEARAAGIDIGHIEHYVPRTHDGAKISKAGREKWSKTMKENIDVVKSFGEDIDDSLLDVLIDKMYESIVLGKDVDISKVMDSRKRVALTHARHRTIVFKSPEASRFYSNAYGVDGASLTNTMLNYITKMTRDIALARTLGPDSKANLAAAMAKFYNAAKKQGIYTKEQLAAIHPDALDTKGGWGIGTAYDIAHGFADAPVGSMLHRVMRSMRAIANMVFLPRATITSFVDFGMSAHNLRHMGMDTGKAYKGNFDNLLSKVTNPKERRELLDILGFGMEHANSHIAGRYSAGETSLASASSRLARMENWFFKWSWLEPWTNMMRETASITTANHLGNHTHLKYSDLPERVRALLTTYDIDGGMWNSMRKKGLLETGGRKFLVAENMLPHHREALMGLYHSEANTSVIMPDARTRRYLTGGYQPGTGIGEAVRSGGQFKSFPAAMTHKVLGRLMYDMFPEGGFKPTNLMSAGHLLATMFTIGYVARAVKDTLDLRTPRNPFDLTTIADVFVQSGVGGIYMDFVWASTQNREAAMLSTVIGPSFNMAFQGLGALVGTIPGVTKATADKDLAKLGRFTLKHTPFVNLYFAKAALDYSILFRLEEYYNPGAMRRKERWYKEKYDAEYYFPPSDYY